MDFLKTLKVPSPVFPNDANKLVKLNGDASIAEAFQTLISHNILSVPLFDEKTNTYINSLSMVDIVLHALSAHSDIDGESVSSVLSNFSDKDHFRSYKAKDVAGKSRRAPPVITNKDVTIDQVVDIMIKTKAHHVLVLNEKGDLSNVITQSRIVESISTLFGIDPHLTTLGQKTVQELHMGLRDVVSVNEKAKSSDAFRMLADNNVSGIAVVNDAGTLVGNISVRDLRTIKHNAAFLNLLSLSLVDYLEASRNEFGMPKSVVTCGLQDNYSTVVQRIVQNKVHRCYILSDKNELVGVISLWDLLEKLVIFSGNNTVNAP